MMYFILYLIGCVLSYLCFKKLIIKTLEEWTKMDRIFGLLVASLSFIGLLSSVVAGILLNTDNDEPAKW